MANNKIITLFFCQNYWVYADLKISNYEKKVLLHFEKNEFYELARDDFQGQNNQWALLLLLYWSFNFGRLLKFIEVIKYLNGVRKKISKKNVDFRH